MSKLRKAVIPAAGLGTRHFPASHAVKKELFPIVGPDGIARALMHYHVLDLLAAGVEEICIIVQPRRLCCASATIYFAAENRAARRN